MIVIALVVFSLGFFLLLKYLQSILLINKPQILCNKHVLITGATKGIGRHVAEIMSKKPLKLTLLARTKADLLETKSKLEQNEECQAEIQICECDVTEVYKLLEECYSQVEENFGQHVDVLINCAGLANCGKFESLDVSVHENIMNVNYFGTMKMIHLFLKSCSKTKHDNKTIVLTSSIGGIFGFYGMGAYSPSKFALAGLAQVLSMENLCNNINVMMVYPPDTDTPGFEHENLSKPELTKLISGKASLYSPLYVAEKLVQGIENGDSSVNFGLIGNLFSVVGAGCMRPSSNLLSFAAEIILPGLLRLVILFNLANFYRLVKKHIKKTD